MINTYRCSDLGIGASLYATGYKLTTIEPVNDRRMEFVFEDDGTAASTEKKFWRGILLIDALAYFNAIKTLKARIHSARGEHL